MKEVLTDYYPDKCVGCPYLGKMMTERLTAINNMTVPPRHVEIRKAAQAGVVARQMCETAEQRCAGIAIDCYFESVD